MTQCLKPERRHASATASAIGICLLGLLLATRLHAQAPRPAQLPLLNPPPPPVKPNLMVTLDDSGSMGRLYMPDTTIRIGSWEIRSPADEKSIGFDPRDIKPNVRTYDGFFTADPASTAWQQRAMRSPDINTIYYNPDVRYRPWLKSDGTRYPDAKIDAARLDPDSAAAGEINLSKSAHDFRAQWCTHAGDCRQASLTYSPGLYYRLSRQADAYFDPQLPESYAPFDVNTDFTPEQERTRPAKASGRTDCAGEKCTLSEEQQNFANWFVYYRSRLHLAKAVLGEVLGRLNNQIRIGYGRIGKGPARLDDLGSFSVIESGVRDLDGDRKEQLLNWIYSVNPGSATPLRRAINEVGRYYEVTDSRGPWGEVPGTVSARPQASCRAAYHLLITDGYWTDTDVSGAQLVGNADGLHGQAIARADGSTWRYTPTAPYMDANSNMLADFAMHFWSRDLRTDLPNNVPVGQAMKPSGSP